jgi:hypothetical protein
MGGFLATHDPLVRGKRFRGCLLTELLPHSMDALVWPIAPKGGHVIAENQSVNMAFPMQGSGADRSRLASCSHI